MEEFNATPFTNKQPYIAAQPNQKAIQDEIAETLDQLPLLKTVVKHLDEKIASTDSIKKALELAVKYDLSTENALIILDIVNQQLAGERSFIFARVEKTAKR